VIDGTDIAAIDAATATEAEEALAPLFEGAPAFLGHVIAGRPYGSWPRLFERARALAHAMPERDQIELIDAHPRLGAAPASVSAMSYREQGYDQAAPRSIPDVDGELGRLNDAYEARFGFRYCIFVAGRPREALLPDMEAALTADRSAELHRALDAVIDIAQDRQRSLHRTPAAADAAAPPAGRSAASSRSAT
jgi:2-oxo-4-hydroxy-4-carboxy--5-ureidoimidazoline (OHCU) decarboxylase